MRWFRCCLCITSSLRLKVSEETMVETCWKHILVEGRKGGINSWELANCSRQSASHRIERMTGVDMCVCEATWVCVVPVLVWESSEFVENVCWRRGGISDLKNESNPRRTCTIVSVSVVFKWGKWLEWQFMRLCYVCVWCVVQWRGQTFKRGCPTTGPTRPHIAVLL